MMIVVPDERTPATLSLVAPGDALQFESAVEPLLPRLVRLARRIAPPGSADDVVQDALLRAWRHRAKFDPSKGSYSGWLFAIVANESRRRQSWRRFAANVRAPAESESSSVEKRIDLGRALSRLSLRQRLAIDCVYYAGLTIDEAASVMNCSPGTVKSTLSDARARLRQLLEIAR